MISNPVMVGYKCGLEYLHPSKNRKLQHLQRKWHIGQTLTDFCIY